MSIIERAIDKMGSQPPKKPKKDASERKPQSARNRADKTSATDSPVLPELDESIEARYQQSVRQPAATDSGSESHSGKANANKTKAISELDNLPVDYEPDIYITRLDIEGVLSPKGGRSRLAEEYRLIKRPLLVKAFSNAHPDAANIGMLHNNVIMVSSSVAGEGKTFTALNLAISIAMEMDQTVLLIDSDLAKPGLSKILQVRDHKGLTDFLSGDVSDIGTLFKRTDIPKLTVLSAGSSHSRSTELLASRNMARLLDELAQRYPDRVIIFDSPPLLATTESVVLARQMGQICLVVESATTPQYMVKQALGSLHSTENVSLILNKVKPDLLSTGYGYGYGYGKGYGDT